MIKKLFSLLIYGKYKPEELYAVRSSLFAANKRSLTIFPAISTAACATGALGGIFSDIEIMKKCLIGYHCCPLKNGVIRLQST